VSDPIDQYRRHYAEVHNPTIPLSEDELNGIRDIDETDRDRGGLSGVHRKILLGEVYRLRRTLAEVEEERDEYARKYIAATNRLENLGVVTDDDY